jgi:hypothetical protein
LVSTGPARQSIDVQPHQLEVADLAIRPLKAGPQPLTVGAIDATTPLRTVVAGDCSGEAFRDDRAAAAQFGRRYPLVGTGGSLDPLKDPPLGRHSQSADDQGAVLENNEVDQSLTIDWTTLNLTRFWMHTVLLNELMVVSVNRQPPAIERPPRPVDNTTPSCRHLWTSSVVSSQPSDW